MMRLLVGTLLLMAATPQQDRMPCGRAVQDARGIPRDDTTLQLIITTVSDAGGDDAAVVDLLIYAALESDMAASSTDGALGEKGMMQMMLMTALAMKKRCRIDGSSRDPAVSVRLAYCYYDKLRSLADGDRDAIAAAYNAGPAAISRVKELKPIPGITANRVWMYRRLRDACEAAK